MPKQSSPRSLPTVAEIAQEAGVSAMTVSRVLNGRTDVAPATRERILRLLAKSGYTRNRAATALRKGRAGLIDVVVNALDSDYHLEIMRGVEERLEPTSYRMAVSATHDQSDNERMWLSKVIDGSTVGAILVLADARAGHLDQLRLHGIPFVVVDHRGELDAETPSVGATNYLGGRLATKHLLSLGHRRIAMIGGPPALGCSRERFAGYRSALEEIGLVVESTLVREGNFMYESGYTETLALFEYATPPTAIFAANDMMAVGALNALRERGLNVPGDVSLIGFDDIELALRVSPSLATVRQPLAEMGAFAASMLLRLIEGEELTSTRVELATTLVPRASTAAVCMKSEEVEGQ